MRLLPRTNPAFIVKVLFFTVFALVRIHRSCLPSPLLSLILGYSLPPSLPPWAPRYASALPNKLSLSLPPLPSSLPLSTEFFELLAQFEFLKLARRSFRQLLNDIYIYIHICTICIYILTPIYIYTICIYI
jgi:hypothetical protein